MLLTGNIQIVIPFLHPHPQTPESIGNNTQLADIDMLDGNLRTGHGSQANVTAHLNHIRQTAMRASLQFFYPFDGQKIGGNA